MMDESRGGFLGLGGLGSAGIGGGGGLSKLSPYLSVDPAYLQTETPEYILNQARKIFRLLFQNNLAIAHSYGKALLDRFIENINLPSPMKFQRLIFSLR